MKRITALLLTFLLLFASTNAFAKTKLSSKIMMESFYNTMLKQYGPPDMTQEQAGAGEILSLVVYDYDLKVLTIVYDNMVYGWVMGSSLTVAAVISAIREMLDMFEITDGIILVMSADELSEFTKAL